MRGHGKSWASRVVAGTVLPGALLSLAGCGQFGSVVAEETTVPTGASTTSTGPTSTPTPTPTPTGPISLAFGGDVHFADHVSALLDEPQTSLDDLRPYLEDADIAMVNLETAVTTRGTPAPKTFHFRTSPTALDALSAAGVDVVTMANNHAVDYGRTGLSDTLSAQQESPIPVVGIGQDAEHAYAPTVLTVRGVRVAVLGASQLNDWTLRNWTAGEATPGIASAVPSAPLEAAVRAARTQADLVVVYLHWGIEGLTCPSEAQEDLAKDLADVGADIVVGSHAHRVQGAGWLEDTFVDYGLGNFIWYNTSAAGSYTTGVLTVTVQARSVIDFEWTPLRIARSGVPGEPSSTARSAMERSWRQAQKCTGLSTTGPTA